MLTYTFSKREKIMLAVLAFVGLVILWYQLVFSNVQKRVQELDSQIASVQDELIVNQSQGAAVSKMKETVEQFEQQGYKPVLLPSYDNTQNLMAYLNAVLGSTHDYDIAFEAPTLNEEDSTVHRAGTISFDTNTYAEARSVVQSIAHGPYPCQVDALGITDATKQKNVSKDKAPVTTNMEVTFFEKPTKNMATQSDSSEQKGQDLSKMKDWNK